MKARHALRLVADVQPANELGVLRRDSGRTPIRVAAKGLDAAEREHHRSRRVAHVGAKRQLGRDLEPGVHLARGDQADLVAESSADERVVDERQALAERRADRV